MFNNYRKIKHNGNGWISAVIIYLSYLERKYNSKFLKILRLFIWQHTLCLKIPPTSFSLESLLTLRIVHPFMIIINGGCKIGKNWTIYHDVTLGSIETKSNEAPIIMDDVYLGCKCSVLVNVIVGEGCLIGAHSLILHNTPILL